MAKFFVYGGLLFPADALSVLHNEIEAIRREAGYQPGDEFKFDTHARPEQVSVEAATEAKRKVIDLCSGCGCKFIVHVILHEIIANQDSDQQVQWAADYVIGGFNRYLAEVNDDGICIVDNLPNRSEFRYLSDKFAHGLRLDAGTTVALDRIKLFGSTCLGASHANSAMDIVLGSFRYCINSPRNLEAAREMLKQVVRLMWHMRSGDRVSVRGRGLILRPEIADIRVDEYKREYEELIEHLKSLFPGEGSESEAS
ncbi:MAG: hypothetical protein ACE5H0_09520 [Bacteroidota bacterium]